jgi:PAS domain S-box-containing protein
MGITESISGKFVAVNEAFCELFGFSREEALGKTAVELGIWANSSVRQKYLDNLQSREGTKELELDIFTRAGEKRCGMFTGDIIELNDGKYFLTTMIDITERKRAEEALRNALGTVQELKSRLEAENIYLQEEIKTDHNFEQIIGKSPKLKKVLREIEQVASSQATVLILGETGTGKELFARIVHGLSDRKDRPLVKVNCAALPGTLIESELFGYEKGAFTGAYSRKAGRFELSDGGTIMLDEIGDMPLEVQAKLLRVIQENEFERLGGVKTIKVDVRIVAVTNRDLKKAVEDGKFRQDLFHRLNVFPVTLPPLRERIDDIPYLVNHFVIKFSRKTGKQINKIPQNVIDLLMTYNWPGNIRELENVIERSVIISKGDQLTLGDWLPKSETLGGDDFIVPLEEAEKQHILKALDTTHWQVSGEKGAAKLLGLNAKTLESKMRKLAIARPGKNPHI